MLIGLAGVTGVGKSYYKNLIAQTLGFHPVPIITTRSPRPGEEAGIDKKFVTLPEFEALDQSGDLAYSFKMLDNFYAYPKSMVTEPKDYIFEIHYSTIPDLKKLYPDIFAIYLTPNPLEAAKSRLAERCYLPELQKKRFDEIDEHYRTMSENSKLRTYFDAFLENNYDETSADTIINFVQKLHAKGATK